ncbi:1,2-phenylacetyl-CoA epoxidase subunit PaaC [Zavarzinia sp. CC-PAN008]|uniref:1,2-phenylacetyl-CoA epoxidase subunit PaaC n=1 Tax=Zavarzinia sp. CC-PAN008 TaxID=3243332 RepID=UPI003F748D62
MTDATLHAFALRLGDDALVLGQRVAEWCGHAPTLELDLALSNMGLDLIGQATHFLDLAAEAEGAGRDADALAFLREPLDYTNCLLVEQPNGDFARTIARHLLFATWAELAYGQLAQAAEPRIAGIAAKAVKEMAYHARLAADWTVRLGDGTVESRQRMVDGLDWCWRFVDELFVADDLDAGAAQRGFGLDKAALRVAFDSRIAATLDAAALTQPTPRRGVLGGRRGHHSEHLGPLLAVMQSLPRANPGATW